MQTTLMIYLIIAGVRVSTWIAWFKCIDTCASLLFHRKPSSIAIQWYNLKLMSPWLFYYYLSHLTSNTHVRMQFSHRKYFSNVNWFLFTLIVWIHYKWHKANCVVPSSTYLRVFLWVLNLSWLKMYILFWP